jgi:hypothetical protein
MKKQYHPRIIYLTHFKEVPGEDSGCEEQNLKLLVPAKHVQGCLAAMEKGYADYALQHFLMDAEECRHAYQMRDRANDILGQSKKPDSPKNISEVVYTHPLWLEYEQIQEPKLEWINDLIVAGWTPHNRSLYTLEHIEHWKNLNSIYHIATIGTLLCSWKEALVIEAIVKELK